MSYLLCWGADYGSQDSHNWQKFPDARKEEALAEYINKASSGEWSWTKLMFLERNGGAKLIGNYVRKEEVKSNKTITLRCNGRFQDLVTKRRF